MVAVSQGTKRNATRLCHGPALGAARVRQGAPHGQANPPVVFIVQEEVGDHDRDADRDDGEDHVHQDCGAAGGQAVGTAPRRRCATGARRSGPRARERDVRAGAHASNGGGGGGVHMKPYT